MLGRLARPAARRSHCQQVRLVATAKRPRQQNPNEGLAGKRPHFYPHLVLDSAAFNEAGPEQMLRTLNSAYREYRKQQHASQSRREPFAHTRLPALIAGGNIEELCQLFYSPVANFRSVAEMRRAAAHVVNSLPAQSLERFASRMYQHPHAHQDGIDAVVLSQLAKVMLRTNRYNQAQGVLKEIYKRRCSPSIDVYVELIQYAIRSRQLPNAFVAYSDLRSSGKKPSKAIINAMWRVLVIASRTSNRLRFARQAIEKQRWHPHPVTPPVNVWAIPSEENIHNMAKTLVLDMKQQKLRLTSTAFYSWLECTRTKQEIDDVLKEMGPSYRKTMPDITALTRAYARAGRIDLALQTVLQHAEMERDYLTHLNKSFLSKKHKTLFHELVECTQQYGFSDAAQNVFEKAVLNEDYQRPRTLLAALKSAASTMSLRRIHRVITVLSLSLNNVIKQSSVWNIILRGIAPIDRRSSLAIFLAIIQKSIQAGEKPHAAVFNDAMLALVSRTDYRSTLLVYKLMQLMGVAPNVRTFLLLAYTPSSIAHLGFMRSIILLLQEDMKSYNIQSSKVLFTEIQRRISFISGQERVHATVPIDELTLRILYDPAHAVTVEQVTKMLMKAAAEDVIGEIEAGETYKFVTDALLASDHPAPAHSH